MEDQRKPIDYIPEPYRQDMIDLQESLVKMQNEFADQAKKCLYEPEKTVTHEDLSTMFDLLKLSYIHMSNIHLAITGLYGEFFKEHERKS